MLAVSFLTLFMSKRASKEDGLAVSVELFGCYLVSGVSDRLVFSSHPFPAAGRVPTFKKHRTVVVKAPESDSP